MCSNPKVIKQGDKWIQVPCGKCIECMQDKQNEVAVLSVREAEKAGSFEFVTLTYSNEHIPMYFCNCSTDFETGEFKIFGEPTRVPEELEPDWRKQYFQNHEDCFQGEWISVYDTEDGSDVEFIVTPSLCREDVQKWFKRCRRDYEYHHGEKLEFKYLVCGEYGPRTGRPHFHVGLYGLSHEQVLEMCEDWRKNYGFVYVESVERFQAQDGNKKDHYEASSKYIGKYIAKGEFESPAVKEGRCEKPRRQTSIGFGIKDDEELERLKSYHYCYDMVGHYDPDKPYELNLSQGELIELLDEINKRKKYNLNGKDYKLPRKLQRRIFYKPVTETELDGTIKRTERRFEIFNLVSVYVRNKFDKIFTEQLQQARRQYGDEVPYQVIREIVHSQNDIRQHRAQAKFARMQQSYRSSKF